jgi:hypothetical protein
MEKVRFTNLCFIYPVSDPDVTWSLDSNVEYHIIYTGNMCYQVILFTNGLEGRNES